MKIDGSLGSLLQGVSQQPARDRLNGQCTLQENMSSNVVEGLTRRPPTDLVGYLGSATVILGWHNFNTRDGNKFLGMFRDDTVQVFDLNAVAQTMTIDTDAVSYLAGTTNMRCSTDGLDNTTVVNPSVETAITTSKPVYLNTGNAACAIVQILGAQYGKTYGIYINGALGASYKPPDGTVPTEVQYVTTANIATQLLNGLIGTAGTTSPDGASSLLVSTGLCSDWAIKGRFDDIILLKSPPNTTFTITVTDGAGGVNVKGMTDTVTTTADLPRNAPHYYAARIAQNADEQKDLWFKFIVSGLEDSITPDADTFGKAGYWKEAVAPDTDTEFSQQTMPHKLVYNAPGFTFSRGQYDPRAVGTAVSNPNPSFVGNTINDVTNFQGRTVFLSGGNVIMSRTNRFTNFWQGSASALADTDPIDINSTVSSSVMLAAVQYNKDLVVFSPKGQFTVFGRTGITPANAAIVLSTEFEAELQAHPKGAGRNVFFAANFGRYTGIREFSADGSSEMNDSHPITAHVDSYLVGKANLLSSSANFETLLVHTDAGQNAVYLYKYIWQGTTKVQSSWSTWLFNKDIVYSFFDQDIVYLVERKGNDYYLLRMPLDVQDSAGVDYPVYLDERFDVPSCAQSFVLPFGTLFAAADLVVVQGAGCPTPGLTVGITSNVFVSGTGQVVTLKKNMHGGNVIVGTRFKSRYAPTMPSVKDQNGTVIGTAKVHVRAFLVTLFETGQITGIVHSKYGDGPEVSFDARIVGDVEDIVGEQPLSSDQFTMPFRMNLKDADVEFFTDSHLPLTLSSIEYVGQYNKRGRRIANPGAKE